MTRVLLIEDNPSDADLFRIALSRATLGRFEVETVDRMSAAVARVADGKIDVVVLDLSLPDSFGLDTLQAMREAAPSTPIVVLTGGGDERVGLEALNKGAQDFLLKGDLAEGTIARSLLFAIERRLFEEQLNRRDNLLAEAQKIATLGSFDWDIAQNHVTCSAELLRIYGIEDGSFDPTYEGFLARTHPDDRDRVHQILQAALGAKGAFDLECRVRRGASILVLHVRGHVVLDGSGPAKRVLGTSQDITERRRLEGNWIVAGRMSSVGTLASGIAHEINNPLASLMVNLEFIQTELREITETMASSRARELGSVIEDALQGAERVRTIVRGLRTFSRSDLEETRVPAELNAILEVAISLTSTDVRKHARLVKEFGSCPPVRVDEARMSHVFVNVILNAAQAMGDGPPEDNEIRVVTSTDPAGRAVVQVRDTGCGIPDLDRAQIFDPFFTTKPIGKGTGLGLSIAHNIVTAHGGEMLVESSIVGKGTTVRIVLPADVHSVHPVTVSSVRPAALIPGTRRGSVLVVDDERLVGAAICRVLGPDHEVATAANGREAMARFNQGERFDVILCDLEMPVYERCCAARAALEGESRAGREAGVPDRWSLHTCGKVVPRPGAQRARGEALRADEASGIGPRPRSMRRLTTRAGQALASDGRTGIPERGRTRDSRACRAPWRSRRPRRCM